MTVLLQVSATTMQDAEHTSRQVVI